MTNWLLRATEVSSQHRWRWLLLRGDQAVAEHEVDLDPACAELEAFAGLDDYLRRTAAPDDWLAAEAEILHWLGEWLGARVLGPGIGAALLESDLDTVLVELPQEAEFLLDRPLELAHVEGIPLARRGIRLVFQCGGPRPAKEPVGAELRVLALFSLPTRTSVLALRRERHELTYLVRLLAKQHRRALHIRAVQYGVTRERLRGYAEEEPGWDILHVAGHGEQGVILLEHPDGSPDPVSTVDLIELLRPARRRLKLAVLGTCHSGAGTAAETLHRLGLGERVSGRDSGGAATLAPAAGLVRAFGVAAVGMRYPVADEFALTLTTELYRRLLTGIPLDRALGLAVPVAAGTQPSPQRPPLSLSTPVLFGARAAGLRFTAPERELVLDPYRQRMSGFPEEPARFVGRTPLLIEASAALAPRSGRGGVLLLGMAGAGKSTAALELAYQHEHTFGGLAWWRAPERGAGPGAALGQLAAALEAQLPRFRMAEAVRDGFRHFLPRLTALLRSEAVLLVLDNLETLLTRDGAWRDPLWTDLIEALTGHGGESRVVLTSRRVPAGLDTGRVPVLPVHALTLPESAVLARELPHLRALLTQDPDLVREVLAAVQGHPGLLALADAAAVDRDGLRAHLADSRAEDLHGWATETLARLPAPARRLAELLACLEPGDRQSGIVTALCTHLGEPLTEPLSHLRATALVQVEEEDSIACYTVHPGVAEAIRAGLSAEQLSTVDDLAGGLWTALCLDPEAPSERVAQAALAAAPYLLRRSRWRQTAELLLRLPRHDRSPATALRALGPLRQCLDREPDPADRLLCAAAYAITLIPIDPAEARDRLHEVLARATELGLTTLAEAATSRLADLARDHGRLAEAIELDGSRSGADDPWLEAAREASQLQHLALLGRSAEALHRATALLTRLESLDGTEETHWQVLELALDAACRAARGEQDWPRALEFNRRIQVSEARRGASEHELTGTRFNEANLLTRLGRRKEAERLLRQCQQVFQRHEDVLQLGRVFSARAQLELRRRRPEQAIQLEQVALRYVYRRADVHSIAICHHNLAEHLTKAGRRTATVVAHLLAATLLWQATGHEDYHSALAQLSEHVPRPANGVLPADLTELTAEVELIPGVRFAEVLADLLPEPDERAELFTQVSEFAERFLVLRGHGTS